MGTEIEESGLANQRATHSATRRKLIVTAGLGLSIPGLIRTQDVFSMADEEYGKVQQTASEHARRESLPKEAFDIPRWVPDHTGPYDLSDPYDNHFAFAKAQANLSGDYYWLAQYGWILICPPSEPAYPFLGGLRWRRCSSRPRVLRGRRMWASSITRCER